MLRVDDFGMNLEGGGWLVMEPTQEQIESMHKEILSKVEEIERSKVVEYQENYGPLWQILLTYLMQECRMNYAKRAQIIAEIKVFLLNQPG